MIGSEFVHFERGVKFWAALALGARRPSLPGFPGAAGRGRRPRPETRLHPAGGRGVGRNPGLP